jgi:hypothetical protein
MKSRYFKRGATAMSGEQDGGNGKQVAINYLNKDISEIKAMIEKLFGKIDGTNAALVAHCITDHRRVDKEIADIKRNLADYVGGGAAIFTIVNIGAKIFFWGGLSWRRRRRRNPSSSPFSAMSGR